jgi:hypothetical protein
MMMIKKETTTKKIEVKRIARNRWKEFDKQLFATSEIGIKK